MDADWVGFSFSFPWRGLISQECFLLISLARTQGYVTTDAGCLGTTAPTWTQMHFRHEHLFPPFLHKPWGNRKTSLLNTTKTETNIHSVCHQGSLPISISPPAQMQPNTEEGQVEKKKQITVGCWYSYSGEKHIHCVAICTKSCLINPTKTNYTQTTGGAKLSYLIWRKVLYWWGSSEQLGSCAILVTPFWVKQALAYQQGPLFFPSFPL